MLFKDAEIERIAGELLAEHGGRAALVADSGLRVYLRQQRFAQKTTRGVGAVSSWCCLDQAWRALAGRLD